MYQEQNVKTSSAFISDRESIIKHLKGSDLQCFIRKPCIKQNMIIPRLEGRDWHMKDGVWYVGENYLQVILSEKLENWLIVQNAN